MVRGRQRLWVGLCLVVLTGCRSGGGAIDGGAPDGEVCVPRTCADLGVECGVTSSCGAPLECGGCEGGLTCGGGGVDHVCGAPCEAPCPLGMACDGRRACVGDPGSLVLGVLTHKISGEVTLNGQTPMDTAACSVWSWELKLHDPVRGYNQGASFRCGAGYAFRDLEVLPGTYEVRVSGFLDGSSLPAWNTLVATNLEVRKDLTGLAFDVPTVTVSGALTMNGKTPAVTAGCNAPEAWTLAFEEVGTGTTVHWGPPCSTDFSYGPLALNPGTYRVTVASTRDQTTLPNAELVVAEGLVVSGDQAGLDFDLQTVALAGKVTVDGQPPTVGGFCSNRSWGLAFFGVDTDDFITTSFDCSSDFTFSGLPIVAGTWRVVVWGTASSIPSDTRTVADALVVTGDMAGLVFDLPTATVSGHLTHNGQIPTLTTRCTTGDWAWDYEFTRESDGTVVGGTEPCDAAVPFGPVVLSPGTWRMRVRSRPNRTSLPESWARVIEPLVVTGDVSDAVVDLTTLSVGGKVTVDGVAPPVPAGCTSAGWRISLIDQEGGATFEDYRSCEPAFAWGPLEVPPGTYRIELTDPLQVTSLPYDTWVAADALTLDADRGDVDFDIPTVTVQGSVTLNFQRPKVDRTCATSSAWSVRFEEVDRGHVREVWDDCNTTFAFGPISLTPGVYEVRVGGLNGGTNLPVVSEVVVPRLRIE